MKKLLSVILAVCMMLTMATSAFAAYGEHEHTFKDGKCTVCGHPQLVNPFVDVPEDAWYHDEIVEAVYTGIINGKSETIFAPDDLLTYAEAVKLAACMSQVYLNGNVTLTSGTPWYQPYADYCRINNITTKNYDYNANATRAGYIEIFANALHNSAFEDINNIPDGSILDVKTSASYAHYVYKLYRAGIVTGVDALHNCKPEDNIKRSEVAAIISRMMNEDKRVKFNMGGSLSNEGTLDDDNINKIPATEIKKEPVNEPEEEPNDAISVLTIYKQPEGSEAEEYGSKYELEVQVYGGKAPYSYQWFYYTGHRNNTDKIANGDYVKDVTSDALVLSVEKENTLLGRKIYCEITDSKGTTVKTDEIKVYGPFSMSVDESLNDDSGKNVLTGRVADGILKKGEKVSVIRNGKVIAIGVAEDLQMFSKSLDETVKGDNVEIVFNRENGVRPKSGDIVVKYQPSHKIDTSDIVN